MSHTRSGLALTVLALAALLCGCGGSSTSSVLATTPTPTPTASTPATTATTSLAGAVTVTGRVTYHHLELIGPTDNPTVSTTVRPVRCADVVALGASGADIELAPAATADDGTFTLLVPPNSTFKVGVVSSTSHSGTRAHLEVRDPADQKLYTVAMGDDAGGAFFTGASGSPVSVTLPSLAAHPSSRRPAGIFNILDAALTSSDMARAHRGSPLPILTLYWSPTSTEGSYFLPTAGPNSGAAIFVRGGNSDADDTDEFDDAVLEHEYGHFIIETDSRDSSLGGGHTLGTANYAALAFNEGLASFLSILARGKPLYEDAAGITGPAPTQFTLDPEGGRPQSEIHGIHCEETVLEVLWDLADGAEGRPDTDADGVALTGDVLYAALKSLATREHTVTLIEYLNALVASGAISTATVQTLLLHPENQHVSFPATGDDVSPRPVSLPVSLTDACVTRTEADNAETGADSTNRFFTFSLPSAAPVTVRLSLLNGAAGTNDSGTNLNLYLLTPSNLFVKDTSHNTLTADPRPEGATETVSGTLPAGDYVVWVMGWPDGGGKQLNRQSHSVPFRLEVTSP